MVLSLEKRWDIVRWTQEGKKRREVAGLAGCTVRTVQNVLRCYHEYGDVKLPYTLPRGGTRNFNTIHINFIIREFEIGQIYVQISNSRVAACCCCRTFRGGLVREVG